MKHCFTYCGDDKCTCPARDAQQVLAYVRPCTRVLETMCSKLGLDRGAEVAREMADAIEGVRPLQSCTLEQSS